MELVSGNGWVVWRGKSDIEATGLGGECVLFV